jgi:hypothetical protein
MLNRIAGWLLFLQASYVASFFLFAIADAISRGAVFAALTQTRAALHLSNNFVRLTDYIYYPMLYSASLNLALLLIFFWSTLRRQHAPSLSSDFFNILNAVYIAGSGWILFSALISITHR